MLVALELQSEFHVLSCGRRLSCGCGGCGDGCSVSVRGGRAEFGAELVALLTAPPTLPAKSPASVIPTIVEMNIDVS